MIVARISLPIIFFSALLSCGKAFGAYATTAQDFVDITAVRAVSEIETAKIALAKSSNPFVKDYAKIIVEEQRAVLKDLRIFAEDQHLNLYSDVELHQRARTYIFRRNGRAFDSAYAEARATERRKVVNLFRTAIKSDDQIVRGYAIRMLPRCMHHLYMAQTLRSQITY
ncbi:MAG: DUF4142 domain-containing protein [Gammaproteobacteria bacterium]|nr:MAG: DUF4142 domain-containing protein [Gammaproteobacteria bacterium]